MSEPAARSRGGALGRLWRGEIPLPDAFWTWAVTIGLLVNGTTSVGCYALLAADRPVAALIVGYLPSVPYNVMATVGVWRASHRPDADPAFARFARVVILPLMGLLSLT